MGVTHVGGGLLSFAKYTPDPVERRTAATIRNVSVDRILSLVLFVLSVALLVRLGPAAWRSWQVYAGVRSRRLADAGPLEIPAPDAVAARVRELGELGFSRIGERYLRLPEGIRYEWNVRDETGATYVSVVPVLAGSLVVCFTSFDDGTWIQTSFPRGETIERPNFHCSFVTTSVADLVATHRAIIERLRPVHGTPRRILTMADTLRMDADYRTRFGGVTLRRLTATLVLPALLAAALAVFAALALLVEP